MNQRLIIYAFVTILIITLIMIPVVHLNAQDQSRGFKALKSVETSDGEIELYSESHALLIAINEYDDGRWTDLSNPLSDVKSVEELLLSQGFDLTILSDETEDKPTQNNILSYLKRFHAQAAENDRLLVFFAGHGHSEKNPHGYEYSGYIIPKDAVHNDWPTYVSMQEIAGIAKQSKAKHIIYLFDSCFSGLFIDKMRSSQDTPPAITNKITKIARVAIAAGSHDEQVADNYGGHSPFCTFFLRAFEDSRSDVNLDGYLTGDELAIYLHHNVTRISNGTQNPLWGKMMGFSDGDVVFELHKGLEIGLITISTNSPDSVRLYIDGHLRPYKFNKIEAISLELTAGSHLVEVIGKYGNSPHEVVITPDGNHFLEANVPLQKHIGTLTVYSDLHEEAGVYLNKVLMKDRVTALQPITIEDLPAGSYFIEVVGVDKADTGTVRIESQQLTEFHADFKAGEDKIPEITAYLGDFLASAEFTYIEGNSFIMGAGQDDTAADEDEFPSHSVTLSPFYIMTTEVTQRMWVSVTGYNCSENLGDNLPVQNVSWHECMNFIEKLNANDPGKEYRLPTEAEWEYACRAGTSTPYHYGESIDLSHANFRDVSSLATTAKVETSKPRTVPVRSYPPNSWGIFEMHGNVSEWCADWKNDYSGSPAADPLDNRVSEYKVHRGGSYLSIKEACRSSNRNCSDSRSRRQKIGFRLVKSNL